MPVLIGGIAAIFFISDQITATGVNSTVVFSTGPFLHSSSGVLSRCTAMRNSLTDFLGMF